MQFNNEKCNKSGGSHQKKKLKVEKSKWTVPNFVTDLKLGPKRKSKHRKRKFSIPCTPPNNLQYQILNDDLASPILTTNKYQSLEPIVNCNTNLSPQNNDELSPVLNTKLSNSPILNKKRHYSDSENELNTSPVINRKSKLKFYKNRSNGINQNSCIKNLTNLQEKSQIIDIFIEETETENQKEINCELLINKDNNESQIQISEIESVETQSQCSENIEIDLVKTQNQVKETNLTKYEPKSCNIFKDLAWKFKTNEDKVEIEIFNSQELLNSVSTINGSFIPSRLNFVEENVEIEIVQSQKDRLEQIEVICSQKSANIEISQSPEDENCIIENIESQKSSSATISSTGTVIQDSQEKLSEEYQLSPVKKKKYKPGTLAYQFHKLLRKQKADVNIWKHELFLSSTTNYQIPSTKEDHLITTVKICRIFSDFGSNILECKQDEEKCFIVVNSSYLFNFKCEDTIKIIPPFYVKYILVNNCNIKTFINVHKILKL